MANDGSGTYWDEDEPANTEALSYGAQEIRDLRKGVRQRLEAEHSVCDATDPYIEHRQGSAKAWLAANTQANRPGASPGAGDVALTADDAGRLLIDSTSKAPYYYSGSAWALVQIIAGNLAADAIETAAIKDGEVTAAKLATTLDLSSHTSIILPVAAGYMRYEAGAYAGAGTGQDIALSLLAGDTPKLVVVMRTVGSQEKWTKTADMTGAYAHKAKADGFTYVDSAITLAADKFTVGTVADATGGTYKWYALG